MSYCKSLILQQRLTHHTSAKNVITVKSVAVNAGSLGKALATSAAMRDLSTAVGVAQVEEER